MSERKQSMGFFNDFAIENNRMHPIAKLFYDAMQECEKLPASEQQTKTVIAINKVKEAVEQELHYSNIITVHDCADSVEDAISDFMSDTNGEVDSHFLAKRLKEQFNIYKK